MREPFSPICPEILEHLKELGPLSSSQLADALGESVSSSLSYLYRAGKVLRIKAETERGIQGFIYSLAPPGTPKPTMKPRRASAVVELAPAPAPAPAPIYVPVPAPAPAPTPIAVESVISQIQKMPVAEALKLRAALNAVFA